MKIAMTHVDLPNESKGGVAHQAHYLSNALVEHGHEVTMFTCSPAFDECLYRVHRFRTSRSLARFKSFLFAYHLWRTDFRGFDIIHLHGDNYLLRGRHPQIRTFHGSALDEARTALSWKRRVYQQVIARLETLGAHVADLNTGVSEATRARLPQIEVVIPNGVDLRRFRPTAKAPHPVVLFVGTSGGRKRGDWLAEIFAREVRPRHPQAELWTVAERDIQGEGVVNFGRVSLEKLTDLYGRAWLFCLPSTYEGFGVPYIEAMASGTCVVATPNVGAREVLDAGRFGAIAPDEQLGAKINELLDDTAQREAYVTRGLERAQEYGWERIVSLYEQLYDQARERVTAAQRA